MTEQAQTIDEAAMAMARISPWKFPAGVPAIQGTTYPRWSIALRAPEDAAPLFRRAAADRHDLEAQITADHQARGDCGARVRRR